MSESSKAVFLSYASQDAEAAKRIADALRGAGVEVWFDAEGGLEHGDEWDAKIRRQIKECVLFIPVISANTQAREEGYFRLEWELAAQRALTIASGVAFILPVLIDGTKEAEALAPDRFHSVQWTKLPGGVVSPEVLQRFLKLWSHRTGAAKHAEMEAGRPRPASERGGDNSLPDNSKPGAINYALIATAIAVVVAGAGWWFLRGSAPKSEAKPALAAVAAPQTEAQKLTAQARALALHDQLDEVTREEVALASQLLKRAVESDPLDGEAWAAYAQCACAELSLQYDTSQTKREEAHSRAERAIKLAPDSNEARFAWAWSYRFQQSTNRAEVVRLHRELAARMPTDKRVLRQAGRAIDSINGTITVNDSAEDHAEARGYYERAAALPGGDAIALRLLADSLFGDGQYAAGERAMDQALKLRPLAGHLYTSKINQLLLYQGAEPAAAQAVLAKIPANYLLDDQGAYAACWVWLWSRQPEECLAVLRGLNHDYIDARYFVGPKTALTGDAHELAGRHAAALAEWRIALQKTEQRIAADPGATLWLAWKAALLARLGEKAAAESALQLFEQLARSPQGQQANLARSARIQLGQFDRVFASLGKRFIPDELSTGAGNQRVSAAALANLRWNPEFDPLRGDPRFTKLLQEAEETLAAQKAGPSSAPAVNEKSVAVLAFANLSDDKANEYFSDGISEELLNVLAKVPGLKVSARTSAFYFKGKEVPVPEIAKQLGVAYVVEGSVRKQGDKVRITAQLIKAADGFPVWSDTFTRDLKDVFAVQDEIAGLIARNLSLKLGTGSPRKAAPVNPEAFELYVQARQAWNLRTAEGFDRAEQMLNRALVLAPDFVRARAALIDVVQMSELRLGDKIGSFGQRNSPELHRLLGLAHDVMAADPELAEIYATLGTTLQAMWRKSEVEPAYRRAVELNPNYATGHHWLGMHLAQVGRMDEALAELKLASELDPLSFIILDNYGWLLNLAGRQDEALRQVDRALALNPGYDQTMRVKASVLAALGRTSEARALAKQVNSRERVLDVFMLADVGLIVEAKALLASLDPRSVQSPLIPLLAVGRREDALNSLSDLTGASYGEEIEVIFRPMLDPVRNDPRFAGYLATVGLTEGNALAQAWRAAHLPEKVATKQ